MRIILAMLALVVSTSAVAQNALDKLSPEDQLLEAAEKILASMSEQDREMAMAIAENGGRLPTLDPDTERLPAGSR